MKRTGILIITIIVLFIGCKPEKVPEEYVFRNAHEAYLGSLEKAGLLETALGRDWENLSVQSLENPVNIELPYQEEFFLDPAVPGSNGYRFLAKRGQKIEIDIDLETVDTALIFIDLFREKNDQPVDWLPVASASESELILQYEPRQDNYYLLRIQPELLRGGKFSVKIVEKPLLKFPVLGGNRRDIGSVFNDPRDGGRRRHHGVDIFASRNTPVLAPARAKVRRTGDMGIGGNHVWLYDSLRNASYYFAHLEEILGREDEWVNPGDTIGLVGNTGNARTTPPHLHFGIYIRREGPVDPMVYILKTDTTPDRILETDLALNNWTSLKKPAEIAFHITGNGDHDSTLHEDTQVRILGKFGKFCRIQLDNSIIASVDVEDLL